MFGATIDKAIRKASAFAVVVAAATALAACDRLPDNAVATAEGTKVMIEQSSTGLTDRKAKYEAMLSGAEGEFLRPYAERENWRAMLSQADDLVASANGRYSNKVQPLLDKDESALSQAVIQASFDVRGILQEANDAMAFPFKRAAFLLDAKKNFQPWLDKAEQQVSEIHASNAALGKYVGRVKKDFGDRSEKIDATYAPVSDLVAAADASLTSMRREASKPEKADIDFALFADASAAVSEAHADMAAWDKQVKESLGALYRSYSKTLIDMRVDCAVQIGRTSWDNYYDWPTEHDYVYQAKSVPCDSMEYFEQIAANDTVIATYGSGWGDWNLSLKVPDNIWSYFAINPSEGWTWSGDDDSEFWINDTIWTYQHRYLVTENGTRKETNWVNVDEATFEKYEDNLGMDIASKAIGQFEDESMTEPAPPGMNFVGNPNYGQWQQGPNGTFWSWFPEYMFWRSYFDAVGTAFVYDSREYDDWRRNHYNKAAYYGPKNDERYGTYGARTRSSSALQKTHFAKTGGFKQAEASLRGAGPSGRGGGPGGGGK